MSPQEIPDLHIIRNVVQNSPDIFVDDYLPLILVDTPPQTLTLYLMIMSIHNLTIHLMVMLTHMLTLHLAKVLGLQHIVYLMTLTHLVKDLLGILMIS